jgi:hypothetical protein
MIEERQTRGKFLELASLLDEVPALSLSIYNLPDSWSVHVYAYPEESPVVVTGIDLSEAITEAVEKYRRRNHLQSVHAPRKR